MQRKPLTRVHGPAFFFSPKNGFTLMEIIIVIFLMGITLSLFLGFNFRQLDSVRLKASGKNIYQMFKGARSQAMIDEEINVCTYDPSTRSIRQSLKSKALFLHPKVLVFNSLLDEISEESDISDGLNSTKPFQLTAFYPDGTALQAEIVLKSGEKMITISVSPLLGKISIRPGGPKKSEDED